MVSSQVSVFRNAAVLVTGGGGSIGFEICRRAVMDGCHKLIILSLTESGLYEATRRLRSEFGDIYIDGVLGSVCDTPLLQEVLYGVQVVVHAAAHKHVPICESNSLAAIHNNVFGTHCLIRACLRRDVERFCLISSDKAVKPVSVMGATKRVAELLVKMESVHTKPKFTVVRFGNVLDSAGSVLPLWRDQIRAGGPLTLTDERCERFFMSIPEAVSLIREALVIKPPGTFVFDMGPPKRMGDLARNLMQEMGREVPIKTIGLRPGEKMTEELHFGGELQATEVPRVMRVVEPFPESDFEKQVSKLYQLTNDRDWKGAVEQLKAIVI